MQISRNYPTNVTPLRPRAGSVNTENIPGTRGSLTLISSRAREMASARQAVEEAPSLKASQVESIRARMAAGTYRVDHEALASKLAPMLED